MGVTLKRQPPLEALIVLGPFGGIECVFGPMTREEAARIAYRENVAAVGEGFHFARRWVAFPISAIEAEVPSGETEGV